MPEGGRAQGNGVPIPVPASAGSLARHYDLTISQPRPDLPQYALFCRWLAEAAARYNLSCALLHDGVLDEAIRRLQAAEMTIGLHLAYETRWHVPNDGYARLAFAIQDAGGHPINLPARAQTFSDKASVQAELIRHELGAAPSLIVRPWAPLRALTPQECALLRLHEPGTKIFLEPAHGSRGRGVYQLDQPTPKEVVAALAQARLHAPNDTWLIRIGISPPSLLGDDGVARPAYWRLVSCLGEVTAFWWSPPSATEGDPSPSYREVSNEEVDRLDLHPLFHFMQILTDLSGLEWFSTDLCLCPFPVASRFRIKAPVPPSASSQTGRANEESARSWPVVAIDYFNDQCDVDVQSRWPGAPPDDFVQCVAWRFAELAWVIRQKKSPSKVISRQAG